MAGLKTLLGLYPKTSSYEAKRNKLEEEYNALMETEKSSELARFKELESYLKSDEFRNARKDILGLRYNNSEEYKIEKQLADLKNEKSIKLYRKTIASDSFKTYQDIAETDKLTKYDELEKFVSSDEFKKVKEYYKLTGEKRVAQSDLGGTLQAYNQQKDNPRIKAYKKFVENDLFDDFASVSGSDKLKKYEEHKKLVESPKFAAKKAEQSEEDFNKSANGKKYAVFQELEKDQAIKNYYKLSALPEKTAYDELKDSDELEAFLDLENFVHSDDFKGQKETIINKKFNDTEEYAKQQELEQLRKDSHIASYHRFKESKEFKNYLDLKDSEKVKRFEELSEKVQEQEFIERKNFLSLAPKERWKQSEPNQLFEEFNNLKKSEKIRLYFKKNKHKKYNWHRQWGLTFAENFSGGKLDRDKWLTRYYWGEELLQESYSLANELHCITDGSNLEVNNGTLNIVTRKEHVDGKIWNPEFGFIPSEFEYTSGLINTGKSFRQKFGWFEAKIRVSSSTDLLNAFWMVGDEMLPHINVFKAHEKGFMGVTTESATVQKALKRTKFASDYHIFSIEWEPNLITWRINGLDVFKARTNIPQNEMYLAFSSGLYKDATELPGVMQIDWVKCYARNN